MKNSFVNRFCSTSSLSKKKELLKEYNSQNPQLPVKKLLKGIPFLSDQHRFITMLQEEKVDSTLVKKISFSRILQKIEREIQKRTDKIYKRIITKERKGKRFDEIILEKIGPLIRRNETRVIDGILAKMAAMSEKSLLKKAYSSFIRDLGLILSIIINIKSEGISRESVETHILENKDVLIKAGIRPLLKRFFLFDPAFEPVAETIIALIRKLDQQSLDNEVVSEAPEDIKKVFAELKAHTEINKFREPAGALYYAQIPYIREINTLYQRLLFRPLFYCFSALRFPLDREIFRKWVEHVPLENSLSEEVMSEFFRITAEFERRYRDKSPPETNEEIIQIVYDSTISFTDKYKLLSSVVDRFPKTLPLRDCLKKIKEVQYKCEYSFVKELTTRCSSPFTQPGVNEYVSRKSAKIRTAIERFKKSFEKLAKELQEKQFAGREIVFRGIITAVNTEKKAELSLLLALDTKDGKNTGFIIKLANFLLEYYFAIDFLRLLGRIREFFLSYFKWGGLYLSPALSDMTKEMIYAFLSDHKKDVKGILKKLTDYSEQGLYEERVRTSFLMDLGTEPGSPGITKNEIHLDVRKYHHMYRFSIVDGDKNILYSRVYKGLSHFHHFIRVCEGDEIQKIIPLYQKQIKVLYQNAFLGYVKELNHYISERLTWFKKVKPLINLTTKELKEIYRENGESDTWIAEFLSDAHKERSFLYSVFQNMVKEEEGNIWKDKDHTKRITIEKHEYLSLVHHIDSLISYVKSLKKICYGESIAAGLKGRTVDEQRDFLLSELARIEEKDDMVGTAAYFLVTSLTEPVIVETKSIIEQKGIDRYRILLALYNVIDSYDDYFIKMRIIEEFSEYLRAVQPDVYVQIKYLLDIQREKLKKRSHVKDGKISDIWKTLNTIDEDKEKIAYLNELLVDCESGLMHYYIEHIRAGYTAENLPAVIKKNEDLPPAEQYDLLCRFKKIYGESALSVKEKEEIHKKELELQALNHLLKSRRTPIFKSRDFLMLTRAPYSEGMSLKNMEMSLTAASRTVVEKTFSGSGMPKNEIKKYLDTNYKVRASVYKTDVTIETLSDALEYFGMAEDPGESGIVADIIEYICQNRKQEAIELFQKKVVVESASKREVDRLARLLYSLQHSDKIENCPELYNAVEKQLKGMESFIINKAKAETGFPGDDFYEIDDSSNPGDEGLPGYTYDEVKSETQDGKKSTQGLPPSALSILRAKMNKKKNVTAVNPDLHTMEKKKTSSFLDKSVDARVKNLIQDKGHVYVGRLMEYVRETYKPVINTYIKSLYKKKSDFYIHLGNKKKYYTYKFLKNAVIKILKEDKNMQMHPELLISLEDDPGLFYVLLYELFEEKRGEEKDNPIYLPKCLD